ncbi:MAG: hypothetical protein V3V28_03060 [Polaribacter sp.]|uniref:hypothetical protein n=1 Tax=Polaribacter sp. TaxID=1920175 RepID=UPI002F35C75A
MRKKYLFLIAIFYTILSIQSQNTPSNDVLNTTNKTSSKDSISLSEISTRKNAIGVSFGTSGLGFNYARKFNSKLNAFITYHSLTIKDKELDASSFLDNDDVDFLGKAKSTIIDLGAEYLPFKNSSFKLAFGVGFLNDVSIDGLITYKEDIQLGAVTVSKQDVGKVVINSKWSGAVPFIGIGFGRAIPKNKLGFGIDIGTYFTKTPEVTLTADKLFAPTQDELSNLQDAFSTLTFIPRIQFRLTYKL